MPKEPCDLAYPFSPGARLVMNTGRIAVVRTQRLALLSLPTGRLVAGELVRPGEVGPAFTARVRPGAHPVVLHLADLPPDGPLPALTLVAGARVVVREAPVARWEMAVGEGQDPAGLAADDFFGYSVRHGTGGFVDASGVPALVGPGANRTPRDGSPPLPRPVTFAAGHGNGDYPTWVGRDHSGGVVCFFTDFFVLTDGEVLERLDDGGG
ncbi:DUF4241 domain-containing protein [Streptomyces lonarensis]|uniref:DUF4241 domain-containing protein n=1 Tax=Streptomyces lonarensis TaxID=700599 RepID=A0A7X6D3C0_9ACTN|nr:DUF4241 domain-containing protein [Streptomyces lonarensis]NJQ07427.1 DUF4241 domain-containing protein [Streptomyces lonarensis]